ncbi:T9SS C-terminal target domain-containing protein [bacterium]|nr:MAG: T9SS C-terminal target domain-containing protein [bacterium]
MKRSLIISAIIFCVNVSFCQSIVTTNKLWSNFIHYYILPGPVIGTENIKFTNDTVINSTIYKKVERSLDELQQNWISYGYIRENFDKQVFYKINPLDTERLLYDLNVQPHETILVYGLITSVNNYRELDSMRFYVRNIDSILIGQSYYKRLNLALPEDTTSIFEQWVDSIGSTGGMLHNKYIYVGCDYYSLLCYFEDGILKYHDPAYPNCFYITNVTEQTTLNPTIRIFPNPFSESSNIEIYGPDINSKVTVNLYNSLGYLVYSNTGGTRITLFKGNLPAGIYFYHLSIEERTIGTGKILIN